MERARNDKRPPAGAIELEEDRQHDRDPIRPNLDNVTSLQAHPAPPAPLPCRQPSSPLSTPHVCFPARPLLLVSLRAYQPRAVAIRGVRAVPAASSRPCRRMGRSERTG